VLTTANRNDAAVAPELLVSGYSSKEITS